ncbi:biotin/lipoyl-containing protein, partial [Alkalimonas sp.]|uniref:biotin/lipoyl-containing protein n=1 Tax=Alkalimonas sp. TaxID=1872453 RepID=UPI00263B6385
MSIEIHVPDIGADEVEITEILVSVGDTVEPEQSLITVEGDKASMEVPASEGGVVKAIKVSTGDKVKTGSLIMLFEAADGDKAEAAAETDAKDSADEAAADEPAGSEDAAGTEDKEVEVPDIGGDEVEVTEIMVSVGDSVEAEQSLLTVEGDKASMEVPAPFAGTVKAIKVATGDKVKTGSMIMVFEVAAAGSSKTSKPAPSEKKAESKADSKADAKTESAAKADNKPAASENKAAGKDEFVENDAYAHASPVVRRLAREFGVNLAKVKGTGRKNRVLREDVQNYVKDLVKQVESGKVSSGSGMDVLAWPKVDFARFGEVEEK